jgi:predicted ATPase
MLIRLRIRGFRNLAPVDLYFGPLTCLAGPNGSGKSNIIDAIRFLRYLTEVPIMEAVEKLIGQTGQPPDPTVLLHRRGEKMASSLAFEAEMLVERRVRDPLGVEVEAAISAVRYTVRFNLDRTKTPPRLALAEETLVPIALREARRSIAFPARGPFKDSVLSGRRVGPFLSTEHTAGGAVIRIHQEGHEGRVIPAPPSPWTVVGGSASGEFPTVMAVHREIRSWRDYALDTAALKTPSTQSDPARLGRRGSHLAVTLKRIMQNETAARRLNRALGEVLAPHSPESIAVDIAARAGARKLELVVRENGAPCFRGPELSAGLLKFIALAALCADPDPPRLVALEEPENSLHPSLLPVLVRTVADAAVSTDRAVGADNRLRQVLLTTHAPAIVSRISGDDLVYLDLHPDAASAAGRNIAAISHRVHPRFANDSWRGRDHSPEASVKARHMRPYLQAPRDHGEQITFGFVPGDAHDA